MDSSKTLYYKDYSSDTWHVCSLVSAPNPREGYILPLDSTDILMFLINHRIFLALIDGLGLWCIPDVEPNTRMLDRLIEEQKEAFESDIKAHWCEG